MIQMNKKIKKYLIYGFLIGVSLLALLPFAIMIVNSTRTGNEIMTSFTLIPGDSLRENLEIVNANLNLPRGFFNSLFLAVTTTILTGYFSALTAYGFAMFDFKGNKFLFGIIMVFLMIPAQLGMLGFYDLVNYFELVDSYIPLIIPAIANPGVVFFLRQYIVSIIPKSMVEAPRMDGASELTIFHRVILPTIMPGIATMSIGTFVGSWNNYLMPLILINSPEKFTLPVMVGSLNSVTDISSNLGAVYVTVAVSVVPIMIAFMFLSRYIIDSVTAGSVKG